MEVSEHKRGAGAHSSSSEDTQSSVRKHRRSHPHSEGPPRTSTAADAGRPGAGLTSRSSSKLDRRSPPWDHRRGPCTQVVQAGAGTLLFKLNITVFQNEKMRGLRNCHRKEGELCFLSVGQIQRAASRQRRENRDGAGLLRPCPHPTPVLTPGTLERKRQEGTSCGVTRLPSTSRMWPFRSDRVAEQDVLWTSA